MKQGCYLAFVYIGLVIGAGFASGREILEYFNFPSNTSYQGVALATFLLIVVCYLILKRCYLLGLSSWEDYLFAVAGKAAPWVKRFMLLYLFCGFFTMLSGCGALLSQSLMLPPIAGILFLMGICFVVLSFDLRGIVALNLLLVPCMIAGILYLCLDAMLFQAAPTFALRDLTGGVLTSALCYVSYNTISAASVLVPLQKGITPKGILIASITGGFLLGLMILLIWLCQSLHFDALLHTELPMLKLAAISGRIQKHMYTLVLFMAICTTAVSQGFGLLEAFRPANGKSRICAALALCLLAFPFSLLGFSNLVANLYSLFGICGLLWMLWIFIDYFRK